VRDYSKAKAATETTFIFIIIIIIPHCPFSSGAAHLQKTISIKKAPDGKNIKDQEDY